MIGDLEAVRPKPNKLEFGQAKQELVDGMRKALSPAIVMPKTIKGKLGTIREME